MIKKTILLFLVLKIVTAMTALSALGESIHNYGAVTFSGPEYPIENITAEAYPENQITVSGVVKNAYLNPAKGTVVIYFLNSNYDVVYTTEADVNNRKNINPGGSGTFKASAMIDNVLNIKKVYIEFVKN
jgi:hypothetical protein